MKKALSLLLASIMALALFAGVTVGAEEPSVEYTPIPGFTVFTEQELAGQTNTTATFTGFSSEGLTKFKKIENESWGNGGSVTLYTFQSKTNLGDYGVTWSPKLPFESGDIFGDTGLTFEGYDGIRFYIVVNGAPYNGRVDLTCSQVPAKGPYYNAPSGDPEADSWQELTPGFAYKAIANAVDGYVSYDFSDDFTQADWWSRDDEGISHFEDGTKCGIPASKLPLVNGLEITVMPPVGVQIDTVAIGDFSIVKGNLNPPLTEIVIDSIDFTAERYAVGSWGVIVKTNTKGIDILPYPQVCCWDENEAKFVPNEGRLKAGVQYHLIIYYSCPEGTTVSYTATASLYGVGEKPIINNEVAAVAGGGTWYLSEFALPILEEEQVAGDVDGDGEVTVADALSVLRVAAKLAQPTKNTGAPYDFDGDGEVTVADALSVLRIAAKLA